MRRPSVMRIVLSAAVAVAIGACASAPSPLNRVAAAYATIANAAGEQKGTVDLWQDMDKIEALPAGLLGSIRLVTY